MHALPLLNACKVLPGVAQTAAGTTAVKGAAIDCLGSQSVLHLLIISIVVSSGTGVAKVQESDTTTDGDFTDVSGLSIAWDDVSDNFILALEHTKPTKRYSRLVATPAVANTTLGGSIALVVNDRKQPVTQATGTLTDFV